MKKDFNVSSEVYSEEAISQAIEDFADVAEITFSSQTLSVEGESEDEIQEVFHEFMNYVLSI